MDMPNRSGLRELQIAQSLVTLRWAAVPMLLSFAMLATRFLGMTFPVGPVYILSCLLAVVNIYFTIHLSFLSRQLILRHGHAGLRRFLVGTINRYMTGLQSNGMKGLVRFPGFVLKVATATYLMLLEAFKGLRVNILSLENVMHSQVIVDILAITLFVRNTGSMESPLSILAVIPVIVAGAVMGAQAGAIYAVAASGAYLLVGLLVNLRVLSHVKFYGPQFGDLSLSWGWSVSSFVMMMVALLGASYLAHRLTSIFKERIYYLNQLLKISRREGLAHCGIAENMADAWFILDPEGNILKYKRGRSGAFTTNLGGRNLLEAVPAFRQNGIDFVLQSVLTTGKTKDIERVRIPGVDGSTLTFSCRLSPMVGEDGGQLVVLLATDLSEISDLKERVESLRQGLSANRTELEKVSCDAREANDQLMKSLKLANDRSLEIEQLSNRIRQLESGKRESDGRLSGLSIELASLKAQNDSLSMELSYKHSILEEVTELLLHSNHLETLGSMIERRSKVLFKLDNACLHVFRTPPSPERMNEILDTRKASPRLLDLPRKNPKVLEPALNDGQPVVIRAEVHPDKSASMAISNGGVHRLVAYVPIRHGNETIGMMMLDRHGPEENTEKLMEGLAYYLGHTALALKNAINTRDLEMRNQTLTSTISVLEANSRRLLQMIRFSPGTNEQPFADFAQHLGALIGAIDVLMIRLHNDGSKQCLARLNANHGKEMLAIEEPILKSLQANPSHKATVRSLNEGHLLIGYPLKQGNRLVGALVIHFGDSVAEPPALLEIGARLAEEHLGLVVLQEEKELWENFYGETLKA